MYRGRIVEYGPVDDVLLHPRHSYTRELPAAIPRAGDLPAAHRLPPGEG
jgi:ABC-type dipeptide/oligopeptide/nickel transport system ATPase component